MTDDQRFTRTTPAWQRYRAARTLAHRAVDAEELTEMLDMAGLTAAEGQVPPDDRSVPAPLPHPARLDETTVGRLSHLLRSTFSAGHRRAG